MKSFLAYLVVQAVIFAFAIDFINHSEKYSTIAKYQQEVEICQK